MNNKQVRFPKIEEFDNPEHFEQFYIDQARDVFHGTKRTAEKTYDLKETISTEIEHAKSLKVEFERQGSHISGYLTCMVPLQE